MESILTTSCRLCLIEPPPDELVFSVFDTYQESVLVDLINDLFSLKVAKSDQLLSICLNCVNRINIVRNFKQLIFKNNRKLQDWLKRESMTKPVIERKVMYEIYADDTHDYEPTQPATEQLLFAPDGQDMESNTTTANIENLLDERASSRAAETNVETGEFMILNVAEEDDFDMLLTFESDTDNGSVKNITKSAQQLETTDSRLPRNKCYFCGQIFQSESEFTLHLPEHFAQMPYTCMECNGLVFNKVLLASKHISMHNVDERPFQCRICSLRFVTRCNSLAHERKIHRFKLKQKAVGAQKTEQKTRKLLAQISPKKAASNRTGGHRCKICSKTFTAKKNLTRHVMVHTGETPFKCTQCSRSFRQAGELKSHHIVHQSQRSHQCEQCDTTYRNYSMLSKHRKAFHSSIK